MDEFNKEKREYSLNNTDEDSVLNRTNNPENNLIESVNMIDEKEIMKMASNLLENDSLMNLVKDFGQLVQFPIVPFPESQIDNELIQLQEQHERINSELAEVKKELSDVKKKYNDLIDLIILLAKRFRLDDIEPIK
jgi:hypothetical protein